MTCSLVKRGRLAEDHQEVVEVLEQGDLAVELDVDLALEVALLHLGPPGAGGGDRLEEVVDAVGLGDVGVGPDAEALDAVVGVVQGGEHHDRGEHRRAVGPEPAADVEAVDVGQHQVEQDDVGRDAAGPAPGPVSPSRRRRLEVAQPEQPGDHLRLVRMILDDQGRAHRPFPALRRARSALDRSSPRAA